MNTVPWPLGNGQNLEFTICSLSTMGWPQSPGLYIFTYANGGYWRPLYIGKTTDFSARIPSHELYAEAVQNGATHIHAMVVQQAENRDRWERMLIEAHQPPMNKQYRDGLYGVLLHRT